MKRTIQEVVDDVEKQNIPSVPTSTDDTNYALAAQSAVGYIGSFFLFIFIAVAPSVPYLKQYAIIKARRDVGAFSIFVCAILLYGQAFRILFW